MFDLTAANELHFLFRFGGLFDLNLNPDIPSSLNRLTIRWS